MAPGTPQTARVALGLEAGRGVAHDLRRPRVEGQRTAALRTARGARAGLAGLCRWKTGHGGDACFVGTLLRCVLHLEELRRRWRSHQGAWQEPFLQALADSQWDKRRDSRKALVGKLGEALERVWHRVETKATWRTIGLLPAFLGSAASVGQQPVSEMQRKTAETAQLLVSAITELELWPALNVVLEYTPVQEIVELRVLSTAREVLTHCHSFERMRIVYERALADSSPSSDLDGSPQ